MSSPHQHPDSNQLNLCTYPFGMVETNTSGLGIRVGSPAATNSPSHAISPPLSPQHQRPAQHQHHQNSASAYLTTMLLNSQNCGYLGQRLQNHLRSAAELDQQMPTSLGAQQMAPNHHPSQQQFRINNNNNNHNTTITPTPTALTTAQSSLFTIDSILASSGSPNSASSSKYIKLESPSTSPTPISSNGSSPQRPTRVPAMLHPGLHLGHLAAAAAGGFGTPSDFLGMDLLLSADSVQYGTA